MEIEEIICEGTILAVVIKNIRQERGVHFMTPASCAQQVGYQLRQAGEKVALHAHERGPAIVSTFAEVILVKRGKMLVRLYSNEGLFIKETILSDGDVILLESGAHEITFLVETEIYEVKQGPYIGPAEKRFLSPVLG